MRFPQFLYEIPAEWVGEVQYLPSERARKLVVRLRFKLAEMGQAFDEIRLEKCRVFRYIKGNLYFEEGSGEVYRFKYDEEAKRWRLEGRVEPKRSAPLGET